MSEPTELIWPLGGLDKRLAHQRQRPYTTADCMNVRPFDAEEERERGGSRPGLEKAFPDVVGSGPMRMMASAFFNETVPLVVVTDQFPGSSFSDVWTQLSWQDGTVTHITGGYGIYNEGTGAAGAFRDVFSDLDEDETYSVAMYIRPQSLAAGGVNAHFRLFARQPLNPGDASEDGIRAYLRVDSVTGAWSGSVTLFNGGASEVKTFTIAGENEEGWFRLWVTGDGDENGGTCYVQADFAGEVVLTSQDVASFIGNSAGTRMGFDMWAQSATSHWPRIEAVSVQYARNIVADSTRPLLFAGAGGQVWKEKEVGSLEVCSADVDSIADDHRVDAVGRFDRLYIADHGDVKAEGAGATLDSSKRVSAGGVDWTTLSISTDFDVCTITMASDGDSVVAKISSVGATYLTLDRAPATTATGSGNFGTSIKRALSASIEFAESINKKSLKVRT